MNRGYNGFDKEAYQLLFSKLIEDLPNFDESQIANAICDNFQACNEKERNVISEYTAIKEIKDFDSDDQEQEQDQENVSYEDEENNEMMLLMAQMGFPTQFSSTKSKNNSTHSKKKKFEDLDKIFDCIKEHVLLLLSSNKEELVKEWILKEEKKNSESRNLSFRKFYSYLLSSSMINDEKKEKIAALMEDVSENEVKEECAVDKDLLASFVDTVDDYVTKNCTDWIQELNLSDRYTSLMNNQCVDFARHTLNSLGFSFEQETNSTGLYNLYPVVPAKSVIYSLKHDLSIVKDEDPEPFEEQEEEENPLNKYYFQRYRFFDKFDEGILLDEESWYSVTPSVIARHTARRFKNLYTRDKIPVVIDAFCGAGGNAIRFAEEGFIVLAIDIDPRKLQLLLHNASIYGVRDRIVPICKDYFSLSSWIHTDHCPTSVSFLFSLTVGINISPPWGGPEYLEKDTFDIDVMQFTLIMSAALTLSQNISCFIPRQSNCSQILTWFAQEGRHFGDGLPRMEIEQNCVQNKVKALTLYTNSLVQTQNIVFM